MSKQNQIDAERTAMRQAITAIIITILVVVAGVLCSCKTQTPTSQQTIETTDATETTVRPRDIPVTVDPDSAQIKALLRCDSAYNVVLNELAALQGERINTDVSAKKQPDGGLLLTVDCKEDSLQRIVHAQDSIIKSLKTKKEQETIYVPVEKPISNYYKNTSAGFWVLLFILVAIIGFKAYKIYLKIQTGGIL